MYGSVTGLAMGGRNPSPTRPFRQPIGLADAWPDALSRYSLFGHGHQRNLAQHRYPRVGSCSLCGRSRRDASSSRDISFGENRLLLGTAGLVGSVQGEALSSAIVHVASLRLS